MWRDLCDAAPLTGQSIRWPSDPYRPDSLNDYWRTGLTRITWTRSTEFPFWASFRKLPRTQLELILPLTTMLFANFNQDFSYVLPLKLKDGPYVSNGYRCISVGTRKGYSITNCDPFGRVYTMSKEAFYSLYASWRIRFGKMMVRGALWKCYFARL